MKSLRRSLDICLLSALVMLLMSVNSLAQRAADPNAIELSKYLITIDSQIFSGARVPLNIGDVNGDGSDDVLTGHQYTDSLSVTHRFYQAKLLSPQGLAGSIPVSLQADVTTTIDLNGDGTNDLILEQPGDGQYGSSILWGVKTSVLFDTSRTTALLHPSINNNLPAFEADMDADGVTDIVTTDGEKLMLYRGGTSTKNSASLLPSDSVAITDNRFSVVGTRSGQFSQDKHPSILVASSHIENDSFYRALYKISYYPNNLGSGGRLWNSQPVDLFFDTLQHPDVYVYVPPMVVGDITGDGIDDLIVEDSTHIYVFAGGPTFGTKQLTKADADYVITSPAVLDPAHFPSLQWGIKLYVLGDITGSGVPFLAVVCGGGSTEAISGMTFLYAGGKALDTYYDATISYPQTNAISLATVKLSNSRQGLIYHHGLQGATIDQFLSQGLENIPHRLFSSVKGNGIDKADGTNGSIAVEYTSKGRTELMPHGILAGEYRVRVLDACGRDASPAQTAFLTPETAVPINVAGLASGVYFLSVEGEGTTLRTKVVVLAR